jgi:hypothetical protein
MSTIVLRSFGGMQPSANAKALPDGAATWAQNLSLRFGDFRPLPQPAALGAPLAAGQTLYRFESGGGFITNPGVVNYVRGPIPNDALERTYYTGDGLPKVVTQFGEVRQLGVPAPGAAPVIELVATGQYSTDDAAKAQAAKLSEFVSAVWNHVTHPYVGLADADLAARFVPGPAEAPWSYSFKFPGALVAGAFVPTNPAHANLMDDRMGFHVDTVGGAVYGFCSMTVRGFQILFDGGLGDALDALRDPSDTSRALLSADQIDTITTSLTDALKPADAARDLAIARLLQLKADFVTLADTGSAAAAANVGGVKAFYQRADVTGAIDDAVALAVSAIFDAMFTYNNP